jgi:hypothetical protein
LLISCSYEKIRGIVDITEEVRSTALLAALKPDPEGALNPFRLVAALRALATTTQPRPAKIP